MTEPIADQGVALPKEAMPTAEKNVIDDLMPRPGVVIDGSNNAARLRADGRTKEIQISDKLSESVSAAFIHYSGGGHETLYLDRQGRPGVVVRCGEDIPLLSHRYEYDDRGRLVEDWKIVSGITKGSQVGRTDKYQYASDDPDSKGNFGYVVETILGVDNTSK